MSSKGMIKIDGDVNRVPERDEVSYSIGLDTETEGQPVLSIELETNDNVVIRVRNEGRDWGEYAYGLELTLFEQNEEGELVEEIGEGKISYTYEPVDHLPDIDTRYTELWHIDIKEPWRRKRYGSFLYDIAQTIAEYIGGTFLGSIGSSAITQITEEAKERNGNTVEFLESRGIPRYNIVNSGCFIANVQFMIDPEDPEKEMVENHLDKDGDKHSPSILEV